MDTHDNLWKAKLGRVGFHSDLPWFEEAHISETLVTAESIMGDAIPDTLPPLLSGGVIVMTDAFFASDGSVSSSDRESGGTGVIRRRVRCPLYPVDVYKTAGGMSYVFTDSESGPSALLRMCRRYGFVVECVDANGDVRIVDEEYYVLNGYVVFPSPQSEVYFLSFFEYTGRLGVVSADMAESNTGGVAAETASASAVTTTTTAAAAAAAVSSDDIEEGVTNRFLTMSNLSSMLRMFTSDDLPEGVSSKYFDVAQAVSVSRLQVEERLEALSTTDLREADGALFFTEARVAEAAKAVRMSLLIEDEASSHFNLDSLRLKLQSCDSSHVPEGGDNLYFTHARALSVASSVCEVLATGDISESGTNLYFTADRARNAVRPLVEESVSAMREGLTLDAIAVGSDPFVHKDTFECVILSLASVAPTTSDVAEHPDGPLYFTAERTLACVVDALSVASAQTLSVATAQTLSVASLLMSLDTSMVAEHESHRFFSPALLKEHAGSITTDDIVEGSRLFWDKEAADDMIVELATSVCGESISLLRETWDVATTLDLAALTTESLSEAPTHQFFTAERVLSVVGAMTVVPEVIDRSFVSVDEHGALWDRSFAQKTADDLGEGSVHKFFDASVVAQMIRGTSVDDLVPGDSTYTPAKALEVVRGCTLDDVADGGQRSLLTLASIDLWLGTKTSDDVVEGTSSLYWTDRRAAALASSVSATMPRTTDDIEEGSNLYFTPDRVGSIVDGALSAYTTRVALGDLLKEERDASQTILDGARADIFLSVAALRTDDVGEGTRMYFTPERCLSCAAAALTLDEIRDGRSRRLMTEGEVVTIVQGSIAGGDVQIGSHLLDESEGALFFTEERVLDAMRPSMTDVGDSIHSIQSRLSNLQFSSSTLSDDRLKFDEALLEGALSVVMAVTPMSYRMVLSLGSTPDDVDSFYDVGFLAQEVLSVQGLSHAVVVGDETTPFSLDYHSVTTFAVGAIQELAQRTLDDVPEGVTNVHLTQQSFDQFAQPIVESISQLTTSDVAENGDSLFFSPARVASSLLALGGAGVLPPDLEQFRYLLSHITTDEVAEGSQNKYKSDQTTDDIPEGAVNTYFTAPRCLSVCDALVTDRVSSITADDVDETVNRKYLTLSTLIDFLRFTTADHIGNGSANKFLNLDSFLQLNITTSHIQEGDNAYFTAGRCQAAVLGMSSDNWTEGDLNKYATPGNVRTALTLGSTTDDLPEGETNKYVTRESYLGLQISVGDIVGHEGIATKAEADAMKATLRSEDAEIALSLSSVLSATEQTLRSDIAVTAEGLSAATEALGARADADLLSMSSTLRNELSVAVEIQASIQAAATISVHSTLSVALTDATEGIGVTITALQGGLDAAALSLQGGLDAAALSLQGGLDATALSLQGGLDATALSLQGGLDAASLSLQGGLDATALSLQGGLDAASLSLQGGLDAASLSLQGGLDATALSLQAAIGASGEAQRSLVLSVGDMLSEALSVAVLETRAHLDAADLSLAASITAQGEEVAALFSGGVEELTQLISTSAAATLEVALDATTDEIQQLQADALSTFALASDVASLSTDDIQEGGSLYFTGARVLDVLSALTSDDLSEGGHNLFATKENVLGLGIHLSDFQGYSALILSTGGELVTDDIFMERLNRLVTTDTIREGVANSYVSTEAVRLALAGVTTDDLEEGVANKYVSKDSVSQVLDVDVLISTGITAADLNARPTGEAIASEDITETDNLFHTAERVRDVISSSTTDDLPEGLSNRYYTDARVLGVLSSTSTTAIDEGDNLYFTGGRVVSALSLATSDDIREGLLNKYVTKGNVASVVTTDDIAEGDAKYFDAALVAEVLSAPPDPPSLDVVVAGESGSVTATVSFDFRTCARVTCSIHDAEGVVTVRQESIVAAMVTFTFDAVAVGEDMNMVVELQTPNGTSLASTPFTVPPIPLSIEGVSVRSDENAVTAIAVATNSNGNCVLVFEQTSHRLFEKAFYARGQQDHVVPVDFAFSELEVRLERGSDSVQQGVQNSLPFRMEVSERLSVIATDAEYADETLFGGVSITISTAASTPLDGNKYARDRFVTNGAVLSSTQSDVEFGVSSGTMEISLFGETTFFQCTPVQ